MGTPKGVKNAIRAAAGNCSKYPDPFCRELTAKLAMHWHDQKLDAPSGTAILTAKKLAEVRGGYVAQGHPEETEKLTGARGNDYEGMRIHSVRLPGFVASQEIIFGSAGETLKIRNDSINRECYMPGVMLGCRAMVGKVGLVYGLDKLL